MKIITISRQYGAGGREIGLAVGKELGITLYDRDIIAATAKASSIDASQIEREGDDAVAEDFANQGQGISRHMQGIVRR